MKIQTSLVAFHGHEILTINDGETIRVAMKPICEAIGIDWTAQFRRIQRHPVMATCIAMTAIQMPGDDQHREVATLPLDMLNGWLFGVEASRVKPEIRERLIEYQRECFKVLHDYWTNGQATRAVPPAPTLRAIEDSYALAAALLPEIAKAIQAGLTGKTYRWFLSFDHLRKPSITSIPDDAYMLSYSDMLKTMMSADGAPLKTEELEVFINAATRKLASRAAFHQQRALAQRH
jgi:hypothetical protein